MRTDQAGRSATHIMQCMEVWGGNRAADQGVVMPGLDAWVYCRPHANAEQGGDVHLVSSCATGRITRLLVADISGHGADLDAPAQRLRSLLRRYSNYVDQSAFLLALNKAFMESEGIGLFATALAATFWAPTGYLTLCNAGHPRPLRYRAATRRWSVLTDEGAAPGTALTNLPIGIDEPTRYEPFHLRLGRGDLLLIYTDALTEARAPDGSMLGEEGLLRLVEQTPPDQPAAFIPGLLERVQAHCGGALPDDDLTMLLLHHNGLRPSRMSVGESLRATRSYAAMLGSWARGGEAPAWPEWRAANILGPFLPWFNRRWGGRRGDKSQSTPHV